MCPGQDVSPQKLVEQLQEAGVEARVSSVLPDDFLVATGLQQLIRQGFMQQGRCQVKHPHPAQLTPALPTFKGCALLLNPAVHALHYMYVTWYRLRFMTTISHVHFLHVWRAVHDVNGAMSCSGIFLQCHNAPLAVRLEA